MGAVGPGRGGGLTAAIIIIIIIIHTARQARMQDAFRTMGHGAVLEEGAPPASKPPPAGGFGKVEPLRDRGNRPAAAAGLFSVKPAAARAACVDISDRPSLCMDVRDGFAVVGSSDHALYEVDLKKKRVCRKLYGKQYGHGEWVSAVAYLGDGRVISAGLDSKLCLWSAQGVRCADMRGHLGSISAVATDSGSRIALSAGYDKTIRCWDVRRVPKEMWAIKGHRSPIMELRWGENGLVASGDRGGVVVATDVDRGDARQKVQAHQGHCTSLQWKGGSEVLFSGGQDGCLHVWDLRSGGACLNLPLHAHTHGSGAIGDILVDGHTVVTTGADAEINVLDVRRAPEVVHTFKDHDDFIYSADLCGDVLMTGSGNGSVLAHSLRDGKLLYRMDVEANAIRNIRMCGAQVITSGDDGNVRIFQS